MKRWFPLYNEKFRLRSIISMRIILKNSDSFYDYCRPRRNRKALRMKRKPALNQSKELHAFKRR